MNYTPSEAAAMLAGRVNQSHYIQSIIERCCERQAPCQRACESKAFEIQIRQLRAENAALRAKVVSPELRLFVWNGFFPDYSGGLAFAIASSEAEARDLVLAGMPFSGGIGPDDWGDLEVLPLGSAVARHVTGGG